MNCVRRAVSGVTGSKLAAARETLGASAISYQAQEEAVGREQVISQCLRMSGSEVEPVE